ATLADMERRAITDALARYGGNLSKVALVLGITRQALYRRMEKFGIVP
ncbi:MAG: sigma-54-dependent Fis family transcriptional regulator, partial [Muribaculaceae bacterium]|nr:sigma-54-dependent Fis family transcriptional regulator [Muribaculaceae bacterium]